MIHRAVLVRRLRFYVGSRPSPVGDIDPTPMFAPILSALARAQVSGATILPSVGMWEGATKASCVVELFGDYSEAAARAIADALRAALDQDTVLWTLEPVALSAAHRKEPDALA